MTTPALRIEDFPSTVHLVAMNRFILLPETTLPLVLTDERYAELVESLAETGGYVGFVLSRGNDGRKPEFQAVGCLARIRDCERDAEGLNVLFEGVIRFRVVREIPPAGKDGLPSAEVTYGEFTADLEEDTEEVEGWNLERIKVALLQIGRKEMPHDMSMLEAMPARQIIRLMAQTMPFSLTEKQALLEAPNFRILLELLFELLAVNFLTTTPDDPQGQVN